MISGVVGEEASPLSLCWHSSDVQLGITGAQDELGQKGQVPPSVSLNSLANNSTENALPNALAVCQLWFPIIVPPSWLMVRGTP